MMIDLHTNQKPADSQNQPSLLRVLQSSTSFMLGDPTGGGRGSSLGVSHVAFGWRVEEQYYWFHITGFWELLVFGITNTYTCSMRFRHEPCRRIDVVGF